MLPQKDNNEIISYWRIWNSKQLNWGWGEAWWKLTFWQKQLEITFERTHSQQSRPGDIPLRGTQKTSGPPGATTLGSIVHRIWCEWGPWHCLTQKPWWMWHPKSNHFFEGDTPQVRSDDTVLSLGPVRSQEISSLGFPKPLIPSTCYPETPAKLYSLEKPLCTVQDLGTISYSVTSYNIHKLCNNNQVSHRYRWATTGKLWPVCNQAYRLPTSPEEYEHDRPGQSWPPGSEETWAHREGKSSFWALFSAPLPVQLCINNLNQFTFSKIEKWSHFFPGTSELKVEQSIGLGPE